MFGPAGGFGAKVGIQLAHAGRKVEDYPPWEREKVKVRDRRTR